MEEREFFELVDKINSGTATADELRRYGEYVNSISAGESEWDSEVLGAEEDTKAELRQRIALAMDPPKRIHKRLPPYVIAAAAATLLGAGIATAVLFHPQAPERVTKHDVAPYSQQAVLKTGHGQTLVLDNLHQGVLAQYANAHIHQKAEQLAYDNETTVAPVYDTLQVPAGGKPYRLQLTDGSRVIVNVASALRFPENFRKNGNELELLGGEAYFEIRHNVHSSLVIKAKEQNIEDIGTAFNVNTYADEPELRTTLVRGSIAVNHQSILPGQQTIIAGGKLAVAEANLQQVIAWTNGYFRFNGENIQAVMRELARWYNIQVVYQGNITTAGFYLRIARSRNISEVLRMLEQTNSVHFKIAGRRVTVLGK